MSTALITGASAGIGAEYARQLAARGYDLVLTARREDRLQALADELTRKHGVHARVIAADLADSDDIRRLADEVAALDDLALLINNAGFGTTGQFIEIDIEKQIDMVRVHVEATMRLCRAAAPGMVARRAGGIINVSSIAAFLKGTTYSATKATLNVFSQGLQGELKPYGVRVQALCPGYTYTEFHDTEEYADWSRDRIPESMWMSARSVVEISLDRLEQGGVIVIPGWRNKALIASMRIGLRPLIAKVRDRLRR